MREQIEKKKPTSYTRKILWTKNSGNSYAAEHCIEAVMQLG
jgi:hypothetical protein